MTTQNQIATKKATQHGIDIEVLKERYNSIGVELKEDDFDNAACNLEKILDQIIQEDSILTQGADEELFGLDDSDFIRALTGKDVPAFYKIEDCELRQRRELYEKPRETTLTLRYGRQVKRICDDGSGYIEAGVKAINRFIIEEDLTKRSYDIKNFWLVSKSSGADAIGATRVVVTANGHKVIGKSEHADIVQSGIDAYIQAINKMKFVEDYLKQ